MKTADYLKMLLAGLTLFAAGCKTTEPEPISWRRQSAYLAKVRDPRLYGIGIYQTPAGVQFRGGNRLHPNQIEELKMEAKNPVRPAVALRGSFGKSWPVILDPTSPHGWLSFEVASMLGAMPVGEREAQRVRVPGEDIDSCLSLVPSLRLNQLYIENSLLYVRLADGSIGSLARGLEKPDLRGVIGWDLLKKFEQVQFDFPRRRVVLMTSEPYVPHPDRLAASLPLVQHAGACAVRGRFGDRLSLVLIDPAGDFELAVDSSDALSQTLHLADGLDLSGVEPVMSSQGGIRLGARFLQNYLVTVCPKGNIIHFERSAAD